MASNKTRMNEEISKRLKRYLILTSGETRWQNTRRFLVKGNIRTRSNLLNLVKKFPIATWKFFKTELGNNQ